MSLHKLRCGGVGRKVGRVGYGEAENCFSLTLYRRKEKGRMGFLNPFSSSTLRLKSRETDCSELSLFEPRRQEKPYVGLGYHPDG